MNATPIAKSLSLRALSLVACFLWIASPHSNAQENTRRPKYDVGKITAGDLVKDRAERSARRALVRNVVSARADFANNQSDVNQWYYGFVIPLMTHYRPIDGITRDPLGDLGKQRKTLLRDLQSAKREEFRKYLTSLLLDLMPKIARGNYHPAVRYNAMLILGELNAREAILVGNGRSPAEPLADALPHLLGELSNQRQIDAVRIACIVGLLRHAELSGSPNHRVKPEDRRQIAEVVFQYLVTDTPEGRSDEVNHWMQRRAIEILVLLQHPESKSKLAAALGNILNDTDSPRSLRLMAAAGIGQTELPPDSVSNASGVAITMCGLARDACQDEIAWVEKLYEEQKRNNPSGGGLGPRSRPGLVGPLDRGRNSDERRRSRPEETEQDKQMVRSRRRLLAGLAQVGVGLAGKKGESGILAESKNEPHQTNISHLSDDIKDLMTYCDEKPKDLRTFLRGLRNTTARLESDIAQIGERSGGSAPADDDTQTPEPTEDLEVAEETETIDFDEL